MSRQSFPIELRKSSVAAHGESHSAYITRKCQQEVVFKACHAIHAPVLKIPWGSILSLIVSISSIVGGSVNGIS
jgi:hypothetical protein